MSIHETNYKDQPLRYFLRTNLSASLTLGFIAGPSQSIF